MVYNFCEDAEQTKQSNKWKNAKFIYLMLIDSQTNGNSISPTEAVNISPSHNNNQCIQYKLLITWWYQSSLNWYSDDESLTFASQLLQ